ncbi:hypothetical protein D9M73_244300 [compost metagenome]
MPAFGCQHLLSGVFQWAARIPDRQVACTQAALQVFAAGGRLVMQGQCDRATNGRRRVGRQGQAIALPGEQTAVQVVIALMPDHIEDPDKTPGPAAPFVVINHVDSVGVVPQFTEQLFKVGLRR